MEVSCQGTLHRPREAKLWAAPQVTAMLFRKVGLGIVNLWRLELL